LTTGPGPAGPDGDGGPRVVVVGLGPAGADLIPEATYAALAGAARSFVRTARHPAVAAAAEVAPGGLDSFDGLYQAAATIDEVYGAIVEELVAAATTAAAREPGSFVVYAVPGSPFVAERAVVRLRADGRVRVEVVAAPSFLDLAWDRLGIDPVAAGVRLVDGASFAVEAAGERGPLLVAQCHSRQVLSDIKLAADDAAGEDAGRTAVLLHHLGLADEVVREVAWAEIDRSLEPDHLTALWVPQLAAPVAVELARLDELVHRLRLQCPWDARQTHGSLARHLLEETYETLDAIEAVTESTAPDGAPPDGALPDGAAADGAPPDGAAADGRPEVAPEAVDHLAEELGDLLFQVYFHAVLGAEEGWFTLADVARGVHDKLVARHPHVFGDVVADTPEAVAANWEVLKKKEKGRSSVTEGIPGSLPALALAAKLQSKAAAVGLDGPDEAALRRVIGDGVGRLGAEGPADGQQELGHLLFALADLGRRMGIDPETALRAETGRFRRRIEEQEGQTPGH
jgi:tetrapyrrole methylase family protein / MazG family protein